MNAQVKELVGDLSVVERASRAMSKAESEARLIELAQSSKALVAITDNAERDLVHQARTGLKNIRVRIEKTGKAAREDATAFSKAVIAEEKRLIGLIEPEETRLSAIQKEWDDRKEREKQAKIAAELARVENIQKRLADIRSWPVIASNKPTEIVADMLQFAMGYVVEGFDEFSDQARDALIASQVSLQGIFADAKAKAEEATRVAAQLAELERLKAEIAERDRRDQEGKAIAEAQAKAERDRIAAEEKAKREAQIEAERQRQIAEAREHAAKLAAARAEFDKRQADAKALRDAEEARLAAERVENERIAAASRAKLDAEAKDQADAIAAENARIEEARRKLEAAQKAVLDKAKADEKAKALEIKKARSSLPTKEQLLNVIATHYGIHTQEAERWLAAHRWVAS